MRHTTKRALRSLLPLLLLLCSLSPTLSQQATRHLVGRIVSVADGDTITILTGDTSRVRIRLNGIDCPESGQPFGQVAKQFTSKKVFGKTIDVTVVDTDRYGRLVGDVRDPQHPALLVNQSLVKNGYAWWYRKYAPKDTTLRQLEAEARAAKRGLWAEPKTAIAPWDWRSGKRPPAAPKPAVASGGTGGRPVNTYRPARGAPLSAQVYITNTGHKYHRAGCQYLRRSQIPISLKDAEAQGYEPCSKCF